MAAVEGVDGLGAEVYTMICRVRRGEERSLGVEEWVWKSG
jgi:hypothetical protein